MITDVNLTIVTGSEILFLLQAFLVTAIFLCVQLFSKTSYISDSETIL